MSQEVDNHCLVCDDYIDYRKLAGFIFNMFCTSNIQLLDDMTTSAYDHVYSNFPDESDSSLMSFLL